MVVLRSGRLTLSTPWMTRNQCIVTTVDEGIDEEHAYEVFMQDFEDQVIEVVQE